MIAISSAEVARDAHKSLEKRGGKAISSKNAKEIGTRQLPFEEEKGNNEDF